MENLQNSNDWAKALSFLNLGGNMMKKIKENELANRNFGKILTVILFACLYVLGFLTGIGLLYGGYNAGMEALYAILGLILLAGLSIYFYYKGKHFEVEKDNSTIAVILLLVLVYSMTVTNLWVLLLVGPAQYVVGRMVGSSK